MSLERILYVDDDENLAQLAEILLGVAGFEVRTCAGGAEALEAVESFSPQFILLDKEMPGMDGPATMAALRERPSLDGVPIVFLTAETDPAITKSLEAAGAAAVLPKPIDPATFADEVRALHMLL